MARPNLAPSPLPPTVRRHQLVTITEAAEYVGVHPKTLRRWIAQGRLNSYAAGPQLLRIDLDEIDAMLLSRR